LKEYKNKIIGLSYRLEETENDNQKLKSELEEKNKSISELQSSKEELENKLETNKDIVELLSIMEDKDKDFDIKETVSSFLNKSDGLNGLSTFVFVLHQKIKNYQEEIEECKGI